MRAEDNRGAIVTFDVDRVVDNREKVINLFAQMDDGLSKGVEFKMTAAQALYDRIIAREEIYLMAVEANYLKSMVPDVVLSVSYYE